MKIKVCKFGGSSLADNQQFEKVREIIETDLARRFIVVSAPGKRHKEDQKITDLLLACQDLAEKNLEIESVYNHIRERCIQIVENLNVSINIIDLLDEVEKGIIKNPCKDYVASRGEYLSGKIMAAWLGATYIEPSDHIIFTDEGHINPKTYENLAAFTKEKDGLFVVPGFYGRDTKGNIKTFSRGGSDITGAIVARAVSADVYENWTDVSGFLMADPRIIKNSKRIETISYKELRELSYMGATVLHDEAIFPVKDVGIPIEIKNTNAPEEHGTLIVSQRKHDSREITGIAGRKDFVLIQVEKAFMNKMLGFGRRLLEIFETHNINFEHTPSGIDTMSVIVKADSLDGKLESILEDIKRILEPDKIEVDDKLALIATVGEEMIRSIGFAGRLCTAVSKVGINFRTIDLGSSELNMIVGIYNDDYENAIEAIYNEFVNSTSND